MPKELRVAWHLVRGEIKKVPLRGSAVESGAKVTATSAAVKSDPCYGGSAMRVHASRRVLVL